MGELYTCKDVAERYGVQTVSYTHLDVYKRQTDNREVDGSSPFWPTM